MQSSLTEEFFARHAEGVKAYFNGDWARAKETLEDVLRMRDDGPSHTLLRVMKKHDFVAPPTWEGFRALTEK